MTLKNLYLQKIYYEGIEKKTKNYLIHQENMFYKSLTKHKEFTIRNFKINFNKTNEKEDKSVRFFRRIISIYVLLLFWKKYTEVFMEGSQKNNDSNISKLELIEEIFNEEEEEEEIKLQRPPFKIQHKMTEFLGGKCDRAESVFQPNFVNKGFSDFCIFLK